MAQALLGLEANNPKPKPVRPEVSKDRAECRSHGSSSVWAEHVEARRPSPAPVRAEPVEAFPLPPVRAEVSKPCSESVIRFPGESGAALSPRRATHLFLLRQNKVSQKKATLVPASLRFAPGSLRCSAQPGSRANSPAAQTSTSPYPSGLPLLGACTGVFGSGSDSGSRVIAGDGAAITFVLRK